MSVCVSAHFSRCAWRPIRTRITVHEDPAGTPSQYFLPTPFSICVLDSAVRRAPAICMTEWRQPLVEPHQSYASASGLRNGKLHVESDIVSHPRLVDHSETIVDRHGVSKITEAAVAAKGEWPFAELCRSDKVSPTGSPERAPTSNNRQQTLSSTNAVINQPKMRDATSSLNRSLCRETTGKQARNTFPATVLHRIVLVPETQPSKRDLRFEACTSRSILAGTFGRVRLRRACFSKRRILLKLFRPPRFRTSSRERKLAGSPRWRRRGHKSKSSAGAASVSSL